MFEPKAPDVSSEPIVECPGCQRRHTFNQVLTAQSNQNVIFNCPDCGYERKNIHTSKG
ncbi:hypothetical protein [Alteribacter natronophilus]|uniref:hypothetical protein n=1 Tax=Alteribacter natronophilus TaxID=2583810 RepID=UPI001485D258|nr:hypothetical protein [Alteribacter natronophilus]